MSQKLSEFGCGGNRLPIPSFVVVNRCIGFINQGRSFLDRVLDHTVVQRLMLLNETCKKTKRIILFSRELICNLRGWRLMQMSMLSIIALAWCSVLIGPFKIDFYFFGHLSCPRSRPFNVLPHSELPSAGLKIYSSWPVLRALFLCAWSTKAKQRKELSSNS